MPVRRVVLLIAVACAPAWSAAHGAGGGREARGDGIEDLVRALASDDLGQREAASDALRREPAITLKDIEAALGTPGLSHEAWHRLYAAARERFMTDPRPALGVQFQQNGLRPVIGQVFRNFPAAEVIRVGDLVVEVDGVPLDTYQDARAIILARDPEDELPMTLLRGGELVRVSVRLGRFDDLPDPALTEDVLEPAWRRRSRAYAAGFWGAGASGPRAIETGLSPEAWAASAAEAATRELVDRERLRREVSAPPAVVGGEPRGQVGAGGALLYARSGEGGAAIEALRQAELQLLVERAAVPQERAVLLAAIEEAQRRITSCRGRLENPSLGQSQRRALEAELGLHQSRLLMLRNRLAELERAPEPPPP